MCKALCEVLGGTFFRYWDTSSAGWIDSLLTSVSASREGSSQDSVTHLHRGGEAA